MEQKSSTEYIEYGFGESEQEIDMTTSRVMTINGDVIADVNSSKY